MSPFEERYKSLNAAQREAVDAIEGPVMVIAGPGTGKTTVLTLRIGNILRKTDTPPSGILAITFTEAGVKAMRMKLRSVIGGRADEVRIHTFHGFAASVISEFKDHFPHLEGAKQMTDVDAESFIRSILEDELFTALRPFGNIDFYVGKILSAMSDAKKEAYTPAMIRDFAKSQIEKILSDETSISTRGASKGQLKAEAKKMIEKCERTGLFAEVYTRYEEKKRKEKRMDYDDLIIELLVALRKDELLLRLLQEKFLYLLIDEHQDTNDSQNLLIRLIADFFESPNVFIVGDEKQAIYRFQGASVQNFLKFRNVWQTMKVIHLEHNYRSHQHLLDAGFAMIERNYDNDEHADLRKRLLGGSAENRPVEIVSGEEASSVDAHLVERLRGIAVNESAASVAIITKTNRDLERIIRLLEAKAVPVSSERSVDIFSHPIGSIFFDLAEFFADNTRIDSLTKTLAAGLWGVSFDRSVALIRSLRSHAPIDLERELPEIRELRKEAVSDGAIAFIVLLAEKSHFLECVFREPTHVEVWRGIVTLAEEIVRNEMVSDPRVLLKKLLDYRTSAESRSVKIHVGTADLPFKAMTAHGSKGLEFDYVFIPYATEESWMSRGRGSYFVLPTGRDEGDEVKDARRLLYVALTRAKKHAVILHSALDAGGATLTPLRFLEELDPSCITKISLPKAPPKVLSETVAVQGNVANARLGRFLDHAKNTILHAGLSVTALNHFCACPSAFLYESVLKLPQAPAPAAEKGNAMHQAFAWIWAKKIRGASNIRGSIDAIVKEYFERSLLPAFEKGAVVKKLSEQSPVVARALASHFDAEGTAYPETWSETHLDVSPGNHQFRVPLHGKLDVVIDTGKQALVFDYKTREAMSVAAVKGETKSSDGNYFRQLVFYKLLLSKDSRFEGKEIIPSLVFVSPDEKGRCPIVTVPVTGEDVTRVEGEIKNLIDSVWSGRIMTEFCDEKDCEWCRLKTLSAGESSLSSVPSPIPGLSSEETR